MSLSLFAFSDKDLSPSFILSEEMQRVEEDFYFDGGYGAYYDKTDAQSYTVSDPLFIEGYDKSHENKRYVSTNLLAKLLFHSDIRKINSKGSMKPVTEKELEKITKQLVNHQVRLYGKLDSETYYWLWNKVKEDLLEILTAENEYKSLEIIENSVFFTEAEKKMAKVIIEEKNLYFTSHLGYYIAQKAVEQFVPPGGVVHIREKFFLKNYRITPHGYRDMINLLLDKASELEKKLITDWDNFDDEDEIRLEEIKNTLSRIVDIDSENKIFNKNTGSYLAYLYSKKVIEKIMGTTKISQIEVKDSDDTDTYLLKKHIWFTIKNAPIKILTYTMSKEDPSALIKAMIIKRFKQELETLKSLKNKKDELKTYLKQNSYNKYTIKDIINTIKPYAKTAKKQTAKGRFKCKLTPEQLQKVAQQAKNFKTRREAAEWIKKEFGVEYSLSGISRLLKKLNVSPGK